MSLYSEKRKTLPDGQPRCPEWTHSGNWGQQCNRPVMPVEGAVYCLRHTSAKKAAETRRLKREAEEKARSEERVRRNTEEQEPALALLQRIIEGGDRRSHLNLRAVEEPVLDNSRWGNGRYVMTVEHNGVKIEIAAAVSLGGRMRAV